MEGNLKQIAISTIVLIALVAIVYYFAAWAGIAIPLVLINAFWVVLVAIILIWLIRYLL